MSQGEKTQVKAEDIKVEGSTDASYAVLSNIRLRLARPLDLGFEWVGNKKPLNQLKSAWYSKCNGDKPMNPRLVGKPGIGKTALAYSAGIDNSMPVYFFQGTSDTAPNDLLINPIIVETGKDSSQVEYVCSTLVTAVILGGVCVLDEGNRMQEKAWASLAPLLDSRRYIESVNIGLMIKAHPNFRFVATMNDDASCFELPEYIKSRLHPTITLDFPDRSEERKILEVNLPFTLPKVLDYTSDFLQSARREGDEFSVRDGIQIANYAGKIVEFEGSMGKTTDPGEAVIQAVEQILGVRQARYIKQLLWKERAA